jgi:hypothetical protein
MRTWIVQGVTPVLCGLALLVGVIALGRAARASLHDRAVYTIAFADIDCQPPEGMTRREFLREVQQLSHQTRPLHLLDEELTPRLGRVFAAHPWVESVRSVQIRDARAMTAARRGAVHVELTYRQPVLAVCLPGGKTPRDGSTIIETWSGMGRNALMAARAVDRHGVLLPVSAVHSRLPVLSGAVAPPTGVTGAGWGDRRVAAAAATVAFLKPHLARLRLDDCDIEIVGNEVVFCKPGVRVVWGHAPGQESAGEATAEVKLRRLLDYQAGHDGLESLEHDVRLLAYQGHFPLIPDTQP